MNGSGYVRIYRSLGVHQLWTGERFTRGQAWVDLIMLASWADHVAVQGNHPVQVHRGQVLTSQISLARRWKWDRETVRRFFKTLERLIMCHIETSKATDTGYTLVTIVNYPLYQGEPKDTPEPVPASDAPSVAPSNPASMPHRCPIDAPLSRKGKKGKKGKEETASGLTFADYLSQHTPEGQEVLRQTVEAISSTRKNGKVAQSVLDSFAGKVSRYPAQAVLSACRIYLAKNYAGEGKREPYLVGIIRGEAERMKSNGRKPSGPIVGQEGTSVAPHTTAPKTQGQLLIDRAQAAMRAEQEQS